MYIKNDYICLYQSMLIVFKTIIVMKKVNKVLTPKRLNSFALKLTTEMSKRDDSMLAVVAKMCLTNGTHIDYLKMIWEQSNDATEQVKTILGDELFEKVQRLNPDNFN